MTPSRRKPSDSKSKAGRTPIDEPAMRAAEELPIDPAQEYSLETLGRLYAQAVAQHRGATGASPAVDAHQTPASPLADQAGSEPAAEAQGSDATRQRQSSGRRHEKPQVSHDGSLRVDAVPVTPTTILEALLFVGSADNTPISARKIASFIRGVSPAEIESAVAELNQAYECQQSAFRIIASEQGYRLAICDDLVPICARLRGRERPARLSQAAVEVMAVVAYHQPATAEEVDRLRNHQSGAILSQLVRRGLLSTHRDPQNPRIRCYSTTGRFLSLFGLDSVTDLPQADSDDVFELPS